jgi:hypothetical protein
MWVIVGNWIVKKRIERELNAFKEGKYDEVIKDAVVKGANSILYDEELKKVVRDFLSGQASAFAKWASDRFESFLKNKAQEYGVDTGDTGGGGGINWKMA